ncbi:hypothetical protein A4X13_0g6228 [Tilletia indica]|uniref:Uncharacterized protein n=1 Tax=Tilletia indica TaxID=43049 RepID=A0A177TWV4_9BASI|nr:hypothetical protein A4X13_0g6228 [Tilletia indica]
MPDRLINSPATAPMDRKRAAASSLFVPFAFIDLEQVTVRSLVFHFSNTRIKLSSIRLCSSYSSCIRLRIALVLPLLSLSSAALLVRTISSSTSSPSNTISR